MARIDYADLNRGEAAALADRIVAERGSVLHLYQMLLHSPPAAEGWLNYLTAIRHRCALDGAIRELVIMRIAHLNRAPYEADQHAPIALREGLRQDQLDALALDEIPADRFDARERAVLAYADAMTRTVQVTDAVFQAVRRHFPDRELVELTATVAAYNMVSRFLEALQVHSDDRR
ncbi:Putative membrane protein OS=Castellaniella defragrans (strain DSM / CCUG 39792 / 65Phen) OX=1437824 GN=BN940_02181 PE=4 SV=1 [Castellaniella denitrificans]|uniref:carboxymuconolactone decarboxylase family protein n=1 Tax=Castellaniella sp. TaxID=1955812 RepID=UPI002AFE4A31|nr:carboxymuconolactone decarboxylase family protein [Castellaniella sp.]